MEIDKRREEQHDWSGYGSAQRPAIIMCYHVVDKHGTHRLISINDCTTADIHGDRASFERHLGERYRSFELVGSCKWTDLANQTVTLVEGAPELRKRCDELRAQHGEMLVEPWMPVSTSKNRQTGARAAIKHGKTNNLAPFVRW